jgi:enoyl-CoA hydratase/carnithine racemase
MIHVEDATTEQGKRDMAETSDTPLLEHRDGGVVTLTLNRPADRNPISDQDVVELLEATLMRLDADSSTRVIILTGAGNAFSSGGNLKTMGKAGGLGSGTPVETRVQYKRGIQRLPLILEKLEVPVIAAVNGPAIGAGCDLACMCDIRVASDKAVFAESFIKVGLVPGDGGAWLLPRIVGFSKAVEMALTGDQLNAQEALAAGLVSRVVPHDELMSAAMAVARKIEQNPPHMVRMTRKLLREACVSRLESVLELSAAMQALAHTTADHAEAVEAMLNKRKPSFKGE